MLYHVSRTSEVHTRHDENTRRESGGVRFVSLPQERLGGFGHD